MLQLAWRRLRWTLPLIALPLLTGCVTAPGNCSALALRTYTPAFQVQVANEMAAAPLSAGWPAMVQDYIGLRDEVRACKG